MKVHGALAHRFSGVALLHIWIRAQVLEGVIFEGKLSYAHFTFLYLSGPSTTILTTSRYSKSSCLYSGANHHIKFRRAHNNFNHIPDEMTFLRLDFLTLKSWGAALPHHPEPTTRTSEPGRSRWYGEEMEPLFGGQARYKKPFLEVLWFTPLTSPFTLRLQIFPSSYSHNHREGTILEEFLKDRRAKPLLPSALYHPPVLYNN